jgi:hypothetical protein
LFPFRRTANPSLVARRQPQHNKHESLFLVLPADPEKPYFYIVEESVAQHV